MEVQGRKDALRVEPMQHDLQIFPPHIIRKTVTSLQIAWFVIKANLNLVTIIVDCGGEVEY